MTEEDWNNGWKSIRNTWPLFAGKYRVRDCQNEKETELKYDGYDWDIWDNSKETKGPMILIRYKITHWNNS